MNIIFVKTNSTSLCVFLVFCLFVVIGVMTGCSNTANTRVEAEKDYSYTQFISRLLVVNRFPQDMSEISSGMTGQIKEMLSSHGRSVVTLSIPETDSTTRDSAAVQADVLRAARDRETAQVLVLSVDDTHPVSRSVGGGMQSYETYDFGATVYDVESGDPVFTGRFDTHAQGGAGDGERFGRGIGDDIVDALVEYSLLPSTMLENR